MKIAVDKAKKLAKETATTLKCKVYFKHNGNEFITDEEGNIAKTN